ncbi:phosphoglycerate mutase 2-like [Condylostylus longicornis]|uniref:phosphoglycerate mutase 2-like n=1 Tax=Condylostylus longicornis TaxID=2530218 RepID=UPI00244DA10C|nr:phosphoglycerate mutase 2-like [Condylostylus longicornis]XP_055373833.1 phosphoglycerate mutase 2-like [Condylostylus longicornis]
MECEAVKVYFVRHGESEWNKMNLFCGWVDVDLSEKGLQDATSVSSEALITEKVKFDMAFTSALKRADQTLRIILKNLHLDNIPVYSAWQLNERHYGNLTGFNKRQTADLYGEEKVQIWRRSYDVIPPPITPKNPYYEVIRANPKFKCIPENEFPDCESLETTLKRVVPFWENVIVPEIKKRKNILIVLHGTSLRAIIKHIENLNEDNIIKFNVPNSIPFFYEFDVNTVKIINKIKFLADEQVVANEMAKVASIGKSN